MAIALTHGPQDYICTPQCSSDILIWTVGSKRHEQLPKALDLGLDSYNMAHFLRERYE